jgi:hypothetical protein
MKGSVRSEFQTPRIVQTTGKDRRGGYDISRVAVTNLSNVLFTGNGKQDDGEKHHDPHSKSYSHNKPPWFFLNVGWLLIKKSDIDQGWSDWKRNRALIY